MPRNPLSLFEDHDPELYAQVQADRELALADGALDRKTKLLIAMALDAVKRADQGVHGLTRAAMEAGATKAEIMETLRVAYYMWGVNPLYTAGRGLEGMFDDDA